MNWNLLSLIFFVCVTAGGVRGLSLTDFDLEQQISLTKTELEGGGAEWSSWGEGGFSTRGPLPCAFRGCVTGSGRPGPSGTTRSPRTTRRPRTPVHPAALARNAFTPTLAVSADANELARVMEVTTDKFVKAGNDIRSVGAAGARLSAKKARLGQRTDGTTLVIAAIAACAARDASDFCASHEPFRTLEGFCNNRAPARVFYGAAFHRQPRLLPANYEDGTAGTLPRHRVAFGHLDLPSARKVSLSVFRDASDKTSLPNILFQWGQYIAHDIALTPINSGKGGYRGNRGLSCDRCNSRSTENVNCFPIPIDRDDPVFRTGSCLPFVRSINAQFTLGERVQQNQLTSYIDASSVYSSNTDAHQLLREQGANAGGRLKLQSNGLMPPDADNIACKGGSRQCFRAGDGRNSITMGLASMHTMWVHFHNGIVGQLAKGNPHWDSERLFQEARSIVGSLHQHITYNEFLPPVIGSGLMNKFGLTLKTHDFSDDYDDKCDASVFTEFSTAGFRFGHSLLNGQFQKSFQSGNGFWNLDGNFFNPTHLYDSPSTNWRNLLLGMQDQKCEKADVKMDSTIHHRLFAAKNAPTSGLDLLALNIQRGRDHGLHFYVAYRKHYGLTVPTSWTDLTSIMNVGSIQALKNVYNSVEDIELYPGMMSERTIPGGIVGELVGNMLADQFSRLKKCDRFWYESRTLRSDVPDFQRVQKLTFIRKLSLRAVMCLVMNKIAGSSDFCSAPSGGRRKRQTFGGFGDLDLSGWTDPSGPSGPSGGGSAGSAARVATSFSELDLSGWAEDPRAAPKPQPRPAQDALMKGVFEEKLISGADTPCG